ncbi:MAG: hypothetical protein ABIY48_10880, partial [Acidimicrobiales bacterium]
VVALRSLRRRYRELFSGLGADESPDDLADRNGSDGRSALDHVVAATRTITFLGRALEQVLVDDDQVLHPAALDPAEREWPDATGTVDERISELAGEADALADRAGGVAAHDWARAARVADRDATVSALSLLWDAVDTAVEHLKGAERVLAEARNQR